MKIKKYRSLNMDIINNKNSKIVSTKTALKNVTPINWSEDVLYEKKKVIVNGVMIK